MKLKLLLASMLALLTISALHVTFNVQGGWGALRAELFPRAERKRLVVGFLPVT